MGLGRGRWRPPGPVCRAVTGEVSPTLAVLPDRTSPHSRSRRSATVPVPQGSGVPGSRAHHGKRQDRASATGQTSKSEATRHVLRLGSPITASRIVSRGLKATRPFPEGSGLLGSRANRGICQDCASTTGQTSKSETPPSLPAMRLAYHRPRNVSQGLRRSSDPRGPLTLGPGQATGATKWRP